MTPNFQELDQLQHCSKNDGKEQEEAQVPLPQPRPDPPEQGRSSKNWGDCRSFVVRRNDENDEEKVLRELLPLEKAAGAAPAAATSNTKRTAANTSKGNTATIQDQQEDEDVEDMFSLFAWSHISQDKKQLNRERCKYGETRRTSSAKISTDVTASVIRNMCINGGKDDAIQNLQESSTSSHRQSSPGHSHQTDADKDAFVDPNSSRSVALRHCSPSGSASASSSISNHRRRRHHKSPQRSPPWPQTSQS